MGPGAPALCNRSLPGSKVGILACRHVMQYAPQRGNVATRDACLVRTRRCCTTEGCNNDAIAGGLTLATTAGATAHAASFALMALAAVGALLLA